jgi:hypothetical protein
MALRAAIAAFVAICFAASSATSKTNKPPNKKTASIVKLENKRHVSLVAFEIVIPAKGKTPETVIGKLERVLSAGESVSFPLLNPKGCVFEARWKFEDANDAAPVDLCSDAHIILVD